MEKEGSREDTCIRKIASNIGRDMAFEMQSSSEQAMSRFDRTHQDLQRQSTLKTHCASP